MCSKLMMLMPARVPKMNGSVAGFQRLVECPKCKPAASSLEMVKLYELTGCGAGRMRLTLCKSSELGTIRS